MASPHVCDIAIVGGGLAAAALAHALKDSGYTIFNIRGRDRLDASSVSGGLFRGFEFECTPRVMATRSLEILHGSRVLCETLKTVGSVFILPDSHLSLATDYVSASNMGALLLTGPTRLSDTELFVPDGCVAVFEPAAGYVDVPALVNRLFNSSSTGGAHVESDLESIIPVGNGASGYELVLDGHDDRVIARCVVVACGAWTPSVLCVAGQEYRLDGRLKKIEYSRFSRRFTHSKIPAFYDLRDDSYGRPTDDGLIFGRDTRRFGSEISFERYGPCADAPTPIFDLFVSDPQLEEQARVRAVDFYTPNGVPELLPHEKNLYSFTGGNGLGVKTYLAAAENARELLSAII